MTPETRNGMLLRTIEWIPDRGGTLVPGRVRFIDQTLLPQELKFVETRSAQEMAEAIRALRVRGAPAIGIAGAMGAALAAQAAGGDAAAVLNALERAAENLQRTRPTAVNLAWALDRIRRRAREAAQAGVDAGDLKARVAAEATAIRDEDARMCRAIGEHGVHLLRDGCRVLTHCNAGSLATAEYGTALAPVYVARERGWNIHVFADETRPHLQGARLTAWELQANGVPVTLICDNMAAAAMRDKAVSAVLVGADRIAANGDVANKIGTYGLALLARSHRIPFYVLAPTSTFDSRTLSGADIPIEQRAGEEVVNIHGRSVAPPGVDVWAPIFDVTPAELVTAFVCERGILRPPFSESIRRVLS
jgi:methylthioribose-1-phosphate isomerase